MGLWTKLLSQKRTCNSYLVALEREPLITGLSLFFVATFGRSKSTGGKIHGKTFHWSFLNAKKVDALC